MTDQRPKRNSFPRRDDAENAGRDRSSDARGRSTGFRPGSRPRIAKDRQPKSYETDTRFSDPGERRPFDRERKPFRSEDSSYRGSKPFDPDRKPYNSDRKPYDRDRKPFDPDRKPYNSDRKPYDRDRKPFDPDRKPQGSGRSFADRDPHKGGAFKSGRADRRDRAERMNKVLKELQLDPNVPVRLNRFIAMSGVCSRREADELIKGGQVTVNGQVADQLGTKVMPTDDIRFNGEQLKGERKTYIIMNKPKGYITTTDDPHAENTVMDLLKDQVKERVYPVGRLDKNTTGVLLLTNDGRLAQELTHPSYEKRKIYHVFLDKPVTQKDLEALAAGVTLEDGEIRADDVSYVEEHKDEVGIEIHSGRNRIVRRMFEHLGYDVVKLDRVVFAGFTKMGLRRGFWRFLTPREVAILKSGNYQ